MQQSLVGPMNLLNAVSGTIPAALLSREGQYRTGLENTNHNNRPLTPPHRIPLNLDKDLIRT